MITSCPIFSPKFFIVCCIAKFVCFLYKILKNVISGFSVISTTPVNVLFEVAPPEGVEVTILVRRGVTWYAPGAGTASNGVALQDTETQAARFLRGD